MPGARNLPSVSSVPRVEAQRLVASTVTVLGASGGAGGRRRTTAFLVGDDTLVDAGTGVLDLSLQRMALIDHVFLTHAHLDHIAALPLILDSVASLRSRSLVVHAIGATLDALREHVFNGRIWPDFSRFRYQSGEPMLRFSELVLGRALRLGGRELTPIPAEHTVPAVGYRIRGERGSLILGGDGRCGAGFWRAVNATRDLRYLVIETSFPDRLATRARASKHLNVGQFALELAPRPPGRRTQSSRASTATRSPRCATPRCASASRASRSSPAATRAPSSPTTCDARWRSTTS
jgi:ribonuclease BN (tRNA processing enzyme)